eukprot:7147713-Karenia_brevis.AAC.1
MKEFEELGRPGGPEPRRLMMSLMAVSDTSVVDASGDGNEPDLIGEFITKQNVTLVQWVPKELDMLMGRRVEYRNGMCYFPIGFSVKPESFRTAVMIHPAVAWLKKTAFDHERTKLHMNHILHERLMAMWTTVQSRQDDLGSSPSHADDFSQCEICKE